MILSRRIPLNAQIFLGNIQRDFRSGLHSSDYRGMLIRETRLRYPGLVEGLADHGRGRTQRGEVRVIADADHIVPRSLWNLLVPRAWTLGGAAPATPDILSNLFWRSVPFNRGSVLRGEALDQPWIDIVKRESKTKASSDWALRWMERFLRTKHDEGVNIDVPVDPARVNDMRAGVDVSDVIEFVQRTRQAQPGITETELVDLVEERFPHIRIEIDSTGPRIEIG
jgi:hypothetical protein